MSFSDEEIIAFLLGDADEQLAGRIRAQLPKDADLVDRVSHFRELLNHLDDVSEEFEPPAGLVDRTMQQINALSEPALNSTFHSELQVEDDQVERQTVSCLSPPLDASSGRKNWMDSLVLMGCLIVMCSLTIPAIVQARFESRRAQCAINLKDSGQLLFQFAMQRPDRRYPHVAKNGPEAFSGVFVVRLNEAGLVPEARMLKCASLIGQERPSQSVLTSIPTVKQLQVATPGQLDCWKCNLGGDYAYNLGVFEQDQLVAPKNIGSSHFAILSDAPLFTEDCDQVIAHDGKGINILYDDGQVRYVRSGWIQSKNLTSADHPFRNMLGVRGAGLSISDAALAPSQFSPIAH